MHPEQPGPVPGITIISMPTSATKPFLTYPMANGLGVAVLMKPHLQIQDLLLLKLV